MNVTATIKWFHPRNGMVSCRTYRLPVYGGYSTTTGDCDSLVMLSRESFRSPSLCSEPALKESPVATDAENTLSSPPHYAASGGSHHRLLPAHTDRTTL